MRSKQRRLRESTMATKSTTSLPQETIKDILTRLPVKSLTRFKSISKPFSSLLSSSTFIASHLRRSSSRFPSFLTRRFHFPDFSFFLLFPHDDDSPPPIPLHLPLFPSFRFPKVVGSSLGLVCLDISPCYATSFLLWNIATRMSKLLSLPGITDAQMPFWMVAVGFGFSSQVNDFKLVRIVNFNREIDELPVVSAEVYSWSSDSWRAIDGRVVQENMGSCVICEGQRAVSVNGALHWLGIGVGVFGNHKYVVSFDMGTEELRKIQAPDLGKETCIKVVGFKGSLALAVCPAMSVYPGYGRCIDRIELWVLDDCGANGRCWNKLHSFQSYAGSLGIPIGVLNGSDLVLKRLEPHCVSLCMIDTNTQRLKRISVCNAEYSSEFYSYVESLVPINAENEVMEDAFCP